MLQLDIILNCGFQSVVSDFNFEKNKGVKVFESEYVHSVTEIIQPNGYSFIASYVI